MNIQFKTQRAVVWLLHASVFCSIAAFAASNSDDFNDNSKNPVNWGLDDKSGHGVLTEKNQRLEYTCAGPTPDDYWARYWVRTRFPANADWEMQVDVVNTTVPTAPVQVNSSGITIHHPRTAGKELYIELYSSQLGGPPSRTGFEFALDDNRDEKFVASGSGFPEPTNAAVRLAFNAATKVLTGYYDNDRSDGYQWTEFGSFGLAGTNGNDGNANWELTAADQFAADLYGYSAFMNISSGQMFLDNFMETGGVTPSGAPTPDPVARVPLRFPTNNPLLAAIANLTGNYRGSTPTFNGNNPPRTYDMDVAQDESGKLMAMGTIDGLANAQGGAEISTSVGSVATVNNKPTVNVKTSFTGTADGLPASAKTTGSGPAEIIDMGGGSNAVAMTLNISAKAAGVPFNLKNAPVTVPGSSFEQNLKKNWSLDLDISRKTIAGKEKTVTSAQLVLPNGDTIAYPDKVVKYSTKNGYMLAFKNGTNVTANPDRIDRKSSVTIKNLKFVKQGDDWEPTGGTITYQFLGQKGTANLLEFLTP